ASLMMAQSALTKALAGTNPKLTAQQKLLATQSIIVHDTTAAHGDFQRTLGISLPNAMRVLRAQTSDLMAVFGQGLLPVVMKAAQALRTKLADPKVRAFVKDLGQKIGTGLLHAFTAISKWFYQHWPQIQRGFRTFGHILQALPPIIHKIAR